MASTNFNHERDMMRQELAGALFGLIDSIARAKTHAGAIREVQYWVEQMFQHLNMDVLGDPKYRGTFNRSGMYRLYEISKVMERVRELGEAMAAGTLIEERRSYVHQNSAHAAPEIKEETIAYKGWKKRWFW